MARVKQKAARNGAAGASTRGAQIAKQQKHKIAVQGDPKDKILPTVVSKRKRSWRFFIDSLSSSALKELSPSIVNRLPRRVLYRGLVTSEPDTRKVAFTEKPPPGYTFIAAGNPELTNALKEFTSRGDHKIFVVTITPHAKRHELSRHIHRVGYHFPTIIVDQVCAHFGLRLNNRGEVIDESKDDDLFKKVYQNVDGQRPRPAEEKDQVTINTEGKQAIKDLFPKIPDNDLFRIIKHAFQLRNAKVGTAPELTLLRRAHLAVVAHIRHNYTSYDKLLKTVQYNEARHQVEQETLAKIIEWRGGEDMTLEEPGHAAHDLLKDVIVISDEESDGEADHVQPLHREQIHIEELPSIDHDRGYGRSPSPIMGEQREHQPYPRLVRTYRPSDAEIAQRNQTRYAKWDQAQRDYRSRVTQNPPTVVERVHEPEPAQSSRILVPVEQPVQIFRTEPPVQRSVRVEYEPLPPRQPTPPQYIRDANGDLFERVDTQSHNRHVITSQRYYQHEVPAMTGAMVRTRPSSPQDMAQPQARRLGHLEHGDVSILPSVEGPDGSYIPPRARRNPFDREEETRETNTVRYIGGDPGEAAYIDLTQGSSQTPKRRRLEEDAPAGYRMVRRESPSRPVEHQYLAQPQQRGGQADVRMLEHGEPRYSPRLQPTTVVREHAYAPHQQLYDTRDLPRPVAPVYDPVPAARELSERAALQPLQPHSRSQNYGAVNRNDIEIARPAGDLRYPSSFQASRIYEPMIPSRPYDGRTERENFIPVRESYAQPPRQEAHVRYVYADGTDARQPLQTLPQQHVQEYDRSTAQLRSYAR